MIPSRRRLVVFSAFPRKLPLLSASLELQVTRYRLVSSTANQAVRSPGQVSRQQLHPHSLELVSEVATSAPTNVTHMTS